MRRGFHVGFVGHGGCYNRGCEAILRSTVSILKEVELDCRYTLWSLDAQRDAHELVGESLQVHSVGDRSSLVDNLLGRLQHSRVLPAKLAARGLASLERARADWPDVILSIGGDNCSLDYGPPWDFLDACRFWMRRRVPVVIWGASIGPFTGNAEWEERMKRFLPKVALITARESATVEYLASIGVRDNVARVWDPAFALEQEQCSSIAPAFFDHDRILGFNVSALVAKWFPQGGLGLMLDQLALFLRHVLSRGTRILLVPHVTRQSGPLAENDGEILSRLLTAMGGPSRDLAILRPGTPCRQIKWAISRCRWFIGARTHATIAAVSSGVPTLAIAYSQKARGIWKDIFGHEQYLLPIADLSAASMADAFERLLRHEEAIRAVLKGKHSQMLAGARLNGHHLHALLTGSSPPSV